MCSARKDISGVRTKFDTDVCPCRARVCVCYYKVLAYVFNDVEYYSSGHVHGSTDERFYITITRRTKKNKIDKEKNTLRRMYQHWKIEIYYLFI